MMKSVLFSVVLAFVALSCENEPEVVDPLFYQMSELDSLKNSQKLHEILKLEALAYQDEELEWKYGGTCWFPWPREKRDLFRVIHIKEESDSIEHHGVTENVCESLVAFFLKHRSFVFHDDFEIVKNSLHPFYNAFTSSEWEKRTEERQHEYEQVRDSPGADPDLIQYYLEKVEASQNVVDVVKVLKVDTIHPIGEMTRVEIECARSSVQYNRIFESAIEGFYHLRNYECMRYFSETYLSLFERAHRLKRKIDLDKLEALEFLHPVRIIDYEHARPYFPPPPEPHKDFAP